jgi:uncharacterized protein (TIGR02186 family)
MKFTFIAILVFLFFLPMASAQQKSLQLELAEDHVDITTGFNGTNVVLFGTTSGEGDVVVLLKGPERTMIVRRKGRILGAWMNRNNIEFRRVPSYYDYAATMTGGVLNDYPDLLKEGEIGVDYLGFYPEDADEDAEVIDVFRDSLIRQMQRKGFYPIRVRPLQFLHPGFFKASFELPPGVPTGIYTVEGLLVESGKIVARESKTLQVGQVGFNARVYSFAGGHSFFYGVFAVLMALIAGWSAFTFLRRD